MKSNKILLYLGISVIVLIFILVIGKKAGWFGKKPEIKVAVEKPEKRNIIETVTANGKIQPETEVKISPDVSGEIVELYIQEGDYVEKGKLLLKIKPDIYVSARDRSLAALNSAKARLSQSEAQFIKAEMDYNRSVKLWEQKTISESEFETAESQFKIAESEVKAAKYSVESAQAALDEAIENLFKTTIYAPMSGTISKLNIELGERVVGTSMMTGTELLRIADLSRMEARVEVNENDIVKVSLNDTAIIEVDAYMEKKFKGIVTLIANSANTTGVSADQVTNFDVRILLLENSYKDLISPTNPNPFRPGMSTTADIQTEYEYQALAIPIQAITVKADSLLYKDDTTKNATINGSLIEVVYTAENGIAKIHEVKTGIQDNSYIQIISGLSDSADVIVAPYSAITKKIEDGSPIIIVDKKELFSKE
ncbi:MAG: efflux RND transporter periplasmic adaptor subunit [Bacteroidales bacterium]|nr:efflux RND transporter periplasmic adaptor subunit [Bacteroidales bacterium]